MPSNPYSLLSASTNLVSVSLLLPKLSYVSNSSSIVSHFKISTCLFFPKQSQLSFLPLLEKRGDVFSAFAVKKKQQKLGKGETDLLEMSELDDEDEMDDEFISEDNEDEDEGMFVPLGNMRKWLENKPIGFGEGKAYDTSIEDKLLDEIERSRKAQIANVDNLKKNPIQPKDDKKKAAEVAPSGIRVHIANLPKKKNIHRDLQSAFKEVPGIVNIIPAVTGNKKTKDPICKGFAFIDFKSNELADRFVQQFSGQNVEFGRIQKRIKCSMPNSHSSNSSDDESASSDSPSTFTNSEIEEDTNASSITGDSLSEEDIDELMKEKPQDVTERADSMSESVNDKRMEPTKKPTISSVSLKRDKNQAVKKKKASKVKEQKAPPKLDIPGSAKRLKMKEKGQLIDVFAKYGSQSTLVKGEER